MTALIVILMFVAFVAVDYAVRESTRRMREKKERQAREAVLNTSVRLDFTHEAKSLKRVEVPNPKARILAVDDEAVILDSFRRILVLEGFSVDTVETFISVVRPGKVGSFNRATCPVFTSSLVVPPTRGENTSLASPKMPWQEAHLPSQTS